MYKAYFGLSDNPFSITPDPRYLYLSPRHKEALAHLLYGITQSGGFIQLTGEVGTGKTTLTRALLEQLPENTDLALILNPKVSVEEFLASVCEEFKLLEPGSKLSIKEYVDKLTEFLLEQYSKGLHTVVLIDEAQNLPFDVIEQVRLLTNIETSKSKLLQIILVGQPELVEHLNNRKLRQVAQRVTARYHLIPLNMAETAGYIKHRLRIAGVERPIFTPAAMRLIKLYSGGIPRLINIICDRALLGAYATNRVQIDSKIVTKAAMEVKGGKLVDLGAPIRALKNILRSRSNVKTDVDQAQIDQISIQPKSEAKAKTRAETKEDRNKPRRTTRVKKISSKKIATAIPATTSPVAGNATDQDLHTKVEATQQAKTIINESEAKEIEAIENELVQKQEEKISEDKAAVAVGELEKDRIAAEQAAEKAELEKIEEERIEAERIAAEEAAEKAEQERLEAERIEAERIAAEQAAEKAEQERLEVERLEAERIAAEKAEQEKLEAERLEAERIAAEKAEQERLEAERLEAERKAAEKAEQERIEAEKQAAKQADADVDSESEGALEDKVAAMFSGEGESGAAEEEKLAADLEFGEMVEDFDAPGKIIDEDEEPATEVENFDIYASADDAETMDTAAEDNAQQILEQVSQQDLPEQKHQYDSEDLEEEIDDDIAYELKDDSFEESVNESEILKEEEENPATRLKKQIKEQVKEKTAKAVEVANAGMKASAKLAQAGMKVGAEVGAKVGDKVKNGVSSFDLQESIGKVQALEKKQKIIAGAIAAFVVLVVISAVFIPGGERSTADNSKSANTKITKNAVIQADQLEPTPKSVSAKIKPVNLPVKQANKQAKAESATDVAVKKSADKTESAVDSKKQQTASLSKMVSSLQGLLAKNVDGKNSENSSSEKVLSQGKTLEKQVESAEIKQTEKQAKSDQRNVKTKKEIVEPVKQIAVQPVQETPVKKTQAQETQKQTAKPKVKRSKLEKALRNKSLDKGLATSFRELFKLWRFDYNKTQGKTACEKSKTKGLSCFFNTGSVAHLIRFNRPVIMKFEKGRGYNYALLVKLSKQSVTLDFGGEFKKFSTKDLKKVWKGKYITLWRPPKLSKMVIKPGEEGDHVLWLSMMMDMYDGSKTPRIDRKIYNDALRKRVEAFQKAFRLKVDGVVGKSTMAHMTSAVAFPGVPLLKKNR